jgi:hypothetical protein
MGDASNGKPNELSRHDEHPVIFASTELAGTISDLEDCLTDEIEFPVVEDSLYSYDISLNVQVRLWGCYEIIGKVPTAYAELAPTPAIIVART